MIVLKTAINARVRSGSQRAGLPGEVEVGFQLVVAAAVDAATSEDVARTPVWPQQQHGDAVYLPSEHARAQRCQLHLTLPYPPLHVGNETKTLRKYGDISVRQSIRQTLRNECLMSDN